MTAMLNSYPAQVDGEVSPRARRSRVLDAPGLSRKGRPDLVAIDGLQASESPEEILRSAIRVTRRLIGAAATFAAVSQGDCTFRIVARDGLADSGWDKSTVLPGCSLAGRVLETGKPVLVSDYTGDLALSDRYRTMMLAEGLRTVACVPIFDSEGVTALLYAAERHVDGLGKRQFEELCSTADATGMVMATAARQLAFSRQLDMIASIARDAARGVDDPGELRTVLAQIGAAANGQLHQADSGIHVTPREREVLELLAEGASNRMIATRLVLSETTVKGYIHTLLNKFDAGSRLEIVAIARRRGMI